MFVFLHGLIGDPGHFDRVVAQMPADAPLYVPELKYTEMGFGEIGSAVAQTIRARARDGVPVVVVGNSIGCVLALDLAELADHVILAGPPFEFDATPVPLQRDRLEAFVRTLFSQNLDEGIVAKYLAPSVAQLDHLTGSRAMVRRTRQLRDIARGFPCHPGLGCTDTRITILAGALDFMAPVGPMLAHFARAAPHARLRIVPDCGHAVPIEAPQAVLDVLYICAGATPGGSLRRAAG
ncbi:MAG: alpha/beta hydrolase [Pseudomonadota bacterium]